MLWAIFQCPIAIAIPREAGNTLVGSSKYNSVSSQANNINTDIDDDDPIAESADSDTMLVCDSWEGYNRAMFDLNTKIDRTIILPASKVYRAMLFPNWARQGVGNFLSNLREPTYMFNSILQGDPRAFFSSSFRFVFNSIFGLFGFIDWAKHKVPQKKVDFASTLQHWGVVNGNYMILPVLGPSTVRSTVGLIADILTDPFLYAFPSGVIEKMLLLNIVHQRDTYDDLIKEIESTSLDRYLTFRSIYLQKHVDKNPKCIAILKGIKSK